MIVFSLTFMFKSNLVSAPSPFPVNPDPKNWVNKRQILIEKKKKGNGSVLIVIMG